MRQYFRNPNLTVALSLSGIDFENNEIYLKTITEDLKLFEYNCHTNDRSNTKPFLLKTVGIFLILNLELQMTV
jgi:hypothetical protein